MLLYTVEIRDKHTGRSLREYTVEAPGWQQAAAWVRRWQCLSNEEPGHVVRED
jgi:hypothetical protein